MNHTIKLGLILGSTILLIGLILSFIAFACTGFNIYKLDLTPDYKKITKSVDSDQLENISIKTINHRITITPSNDNQIHITYYENKLETYTVETINKSLNVNYQDNQSIWEHLFQGFRYGMINTKVLKAEVIIEIPMDYNGNLTVKSTNNNIKIDGIKLNDATINNTNGPIYMEESTFSNLNIHNTNGSIKLVNITTDIINTSSTNGSIRFDYLKGNKLNFKNTNGSIKGIIIGNKTDFNIQVSKVNGSNNLDNQIANTDKLLSTRTVNGSTKIEFKG